MLLVFLQQKSKAFEVVRRFAISFIRALLVFLQQNRSAFDVFRNNVANVPVEAFNARIAFELFLI